MFKNLFTSKVAKQTLFLFVAQIFGMVVGFVSNMLLAKQMGATNFGIYSLSLAIITFISIFFEFGYFSSASKMYFIGFFYRICARDFIFARKNF